MNDKSPQRKLGSIDNRGSHFYPAKYWATALATQDEDKDLADEFAPIAKALDEQETTIVNELNGVQGQAVETEGYYFANRELLDKAMRPSATFNSIIAKLG